MAWAGSRDGMASCSAAGRPKASSPASDRVSGLQDGVRDDLGEVRLADQDLLAGAVGGAEFELNQIGDGLEAGQFIFGSVEHLALGEVGVAANRHSDHFVVLQVNT